MRYVDMQMGYVLMIVGAIGMVGGFLGLVDLRRMDTPQFSTISLQFGAMFLAIGMAATDIVRAIKADRRN
jgi:hypothetical protein